MSKAVGGIVGGPKKCNLCDYTTDDINQWNEHCRTQGHIDECHTVCVSCGIGIKTFIDYRDEAPSVGKKINELGLKCPKCIDEQNQTLQELKSKISYINPTQNQGGNDNQ